MKDAIFFADSLAITVGLWFIAPGLGFVFSGLFLVTVALSIPEGGNGGSSR